MRSLKSPWKDWRRRQLLSRAGVRPTPVEDTFRAGARSGTWAVRRSPLREDSVVVSVGAGDNIAWDLAMVAEFRCQVHLCDPTPASTAWLAQQPLPPQVTHHPVAIAAWDGALGFRAPRKARGVNFRPLEEGGEGDFEAPCVRFATLARRLGLERVDVLKLDIEGGELEVIPDLLGSGPPVDQLLVEFHHRHDGRGFDRTLAVVESLGAHGFQLFDVSRRGLEMCFHRL